MKYFPWILAVAATSILVFHLATEHIGPAAAPESAPDAAEQGQSDLVIEEEAEPDAAMSTETESVETSDGRFLGVSVDGSFPYEVSESIKNKNALFIPGFNEMTSVFAVFDDVSLTFEDYSARFANDGAYETLRPYAEYIRAAERADSGVVIASFISQEHKYWSTDRGNMLCMARGMAVASLLVELGVDPNALYIYAMGTTNPFWDYRFNSGFYGDITRDADMIAFVFKDSDEDELLKLAIENRDYYMGDGGRPKWDD